MAPDAVEGLDDMASHMTQQRRSLGRRRLGPARAAACVLTALAVAAAGCASTESDDDRAGEPAADDSTTVSIGFYFSADAQEALDAAGAENQAPDFRAGAEVMVDAINADGGIAGHQIEPVYHGIQTLAPDRIAEDQAACTDFTQDHDVLAVVSGGPASEELSACLADAGVVLVYTGLTNDNEATFRDRPLLSEPISISLERLAQAEIDGLVAQDWLSHAPGSSGAAAELPVKLGVVVFDLPAFRDAYTEVLEPGYAAEGVPVSEVSFVTNEQAEMSGDINSTVLRFASAGVTHVTFLTASGFPPGLFMLGATAQDYRPRYGFSSQDPLQVVLPNLPDPEGQLLGAVGVGWLPFGDVVNPTDPDVAPPSYQRCADTLADGGVTAADANSSGLLSFICDGFWFLDAAFEAGTETDDPAGLSAEIFVAGAESLGDAYEPASVHSTEVGPDRHDGVGSIRHIEFVEDCVCFRYTSEELPV